MLFGITDCEGGVKPSVYYDIGTIVQHKLYGYRGVIVAYDPQCVAGDKWYFSNKTQPRKDQAWYHVLVHDSGGLSTYVAQSNLQEDVTKLPVEHPRISCYFSNLKDGRYQLKEKSGSGGCSI
ncbi:MAG: heat shock protein HspQ [Opitutaceae bacterium]